MNDAIIGCSVALLGVGLFCWINTITSKKYRVVTAGAYYRIEVKFFLWWIYAGDADVSALCRTKEEAIDLINFWTGKSVKVVYEDGK